MSCSCWVWSNPGSWLCSLILPLVEATVPLRDNSAPEWYGNLLTLQGLQTGKEGITLFLCCGKNPCSLLGYHCQGTLLLLGSCCSSCSPLGFLTHHPSRERKKKKKAQFSTLNFAFDLLGPCLHFSLPTSIFCNSRVINISHISVFIGCSSQLFGRDSRSFL